jgi:hypothetical protein
MKLYNQSASSVYVDDSEVKKGKSKTITTTSVVTYGDKMPISFPALTTNVYVVHYSTDSTPKMIVNSTDAVFTGLYSIFGSSVVTAEKAMYDDKSQIAGVYTKGVDVSKAIKYEDYSSVSLMMWIVWIFVILIVIAIVAALGYGGYHMYKNKQ